jgi:ATP phosphoribosyltransferase regulatory subunit
MNVRLPPRVRDHLPASAARRRGIVSRLGGELERWGYRAIITPLYEYDEVLRRGLGKPARALRLVEPQTGEVLALRPDLTAQVARLVATRLHDEPGPLRLMYEGVVIRDGRELFQVGVELIDAPQPGGDLEAVSLAERALAAAGVTNTRLDLGHADVARAALAGLDLDEEREAVLHAALLRKDAGAVETLAAALAAPPQQRKLLAALPTLYGGPEVLSRARKLLGPAGRSARGSRATTRAANAATAAARAIDELERLHDQLSSLGIAGRVSFDLGEVRGFDYYTGTRFALYADGVGGALVSGGRYDGLCARYGRAARATGFAVDVDSVSELLKSRGVPAPEPKGGLYVAGEPRLAASLAARLRDAGHRAVLDLDEPAPAEAELKARAHRFALERVILCGRDRLRWFDVEPPGARGSLAGPAFKKLLGDSRPAALDPVLPPR